MANKTRDERRDARRAADDKRACTTRCSFKEPTRPHMLAGFGGGPQDIPSCQVCGEVAPPSFAECPGPRPIVPPSGVCSECGASPVEGNVCEPCVARLEAATAPTPESTGETRRSNKKGKR
jgi:hypothetical protein